MKNRILSLILVVALFLSMVPSNIVFAVSAESTAVLAVEKVWANPGGTVDVRVVISENPGILGATLVVSWDERLTLVADASGEAFSHMTYTSPSRYTPSGTNFVWFGNEVNDAADGIALVLTFQIPETVENNDILPISVTYTPGEVIDGNDNDVTLSITDGNVRVITYKPGDVTGDNRVNSRDLVRLSQYISDGCKTDPEGYNAEVVIDACDVNGDGRINVRDLIRLSQYISDGSQTDPDGYNVVLQPAKMPECVHMIEAVAAKAATCTENGNIAYWYCSKCEKYFADENTESEIAGADIVLAAPGHTVVTDEAVAPDYEHTGLTEGSHCSVCNEVLVEQEVVDPLPPTYHSIIYRNLQGAESPEITRFAEHKGINFEDVPNPVRLGYTFLGWYTASEGGTKVDEIEAGTAKDVSVYAHWELTKYTISYKNAAKNTNPGTYTIEDEIILSTPEWSGLIFSRWTDKNGETVTKIEKGTTGDIELEANWNYAKNLAVSNPNKYTYVGGTMDSQSRYYFIYDIGTIENIVLDTQYVQKYDGTTNINREQSITYKVQEMEAKSASQAIANSVIKSQEWESISEWVSQHQEGWELGAKYCPEIEVEGIKAKLYEVSAGWSEIDENKYTETNVQMSSEVNGTEISNQTVSSISYLMETETTSMVNVQLSKDISPVGVYSYVRAADVKVYAIVTYDPANGEYYLDLYSQVYRVFDTTLFELSGDEQYKVNIESRNQLDFEIPGAQIPEKFYTVEYDANGGSGKMLKSVHELGVPSGLLSNGFAKTGYTFGGWKTTSDGATALYPDASQIRDIAAAGETVRLYAHWIKNDYTIQYDANKPSNASSSVLNMPGKVACSYDTAVTLASKPSLTGWEFMGWYRDAACTVRVGGAGEVIANANLTTKLDETVTLYAKWEANTYTVTFDANGGSGSTAKMTCTYDQSCKLSASGFSRQGWTFLGWSANKNAISATYTESVKNLATSGNVTLYAIWVRTEASASFTASNGARDVYLARGSSHTDTVSTGMSKAALIANGYKTIEITVKFDAQRHFPIQYNNAKVEVITNSGSLGKHSWDTGEFPNNSWTSKTATFTIEVSKLNDDGSFKIKWSTVDDGGSANDGWYLGGTSVTIEAKK